MASPPEAYGLPVWAVILIGVGGASLVTLLLAIISVAARRKKLSRHHPIVFGVYPDTAAVLRSPVSPVRSPSRRAPPPPTIHQASFSHSLTPPRRPSINESSEVIPNASAIHGGAKNGMAMQPLTTSSKPSPPKPPPKPRHYDLHSDVGARRPGWKTNSGIPLLDSSGRAELVNETSETPMGESRPHEDSFSPGPPTVHMRPKKAPKKPDDSLVAVRPARYSKEIILDATPQEQQIDDEFRKLPVVKVDSRNLPADAYVKNRYSSVLPAPESLVPLQGSGYINANFVRGFDGNPNSYIATQAPMENTVDDFWQMVLDHSISVIVMVTYLFEYGVEKCIQYWPDRGALRYGNVEVTNTEELHKEHYIRTTLRVKHFTAKGGRSVKHFAFTGWPEHGMPRSSAGIRNFMQDVQRDSGNGSTLVHCSAGVGRTGVVIAIDIGMKKIERRLPIDVADIVSNIRVDRPGAVQTRSQYRFIYRALREHLEQESRPAV